MAKKYKPTVPYSPEIARRIASLIAIDLSLVDVCERQDMPHLSTVQGWLSQADSGNEKYRAMSNLYARAKAISAEKTYAEMIRIEKAMLLPRRIANPAYSAEAAAKATLEKPYLVPPELRNPDWIDSSTGREVLISMKWRAARSAPKRYGERLEVAHTGKVEHEHTHRMEAPDWIKERLGQAPARPVIDVTPGADIPDVDKSGG
jgi:hypothetical protein